MSSKIHNETVSAAKAMLAIVAIVFVAEVVTMRLLASLGYSTDDLGVMLFDAGFLAVVVAPPIYGLVLIPLRREYEKRLAAESAVENLSKLAITDALTRIMNRRGITVALLDAMAQSERYSAPLCVAMADIDHFKPINDTYGHQTGDRVLTEIAGIFSDTLRMPDKVGRYGGEEFLIILPHTTLAGGRKIAERLRTAVSRWQFSAAAALPLPSGDGIMPRAGLGRPERPSSLKSGAGGGKKLKITVSLGITQARKGEDLEQLLARVDQALYAAKHGGRNLVVARKVA